MRTPKINRRQAFLEAFKGCASITAAADIVGVSRSAHYVWMQEPEYRQAFDTAVLEAKGALEDEAIRRGKEGVTRYRIYRGEVVEVPVLDERGEVIYDDVPVLDADDQPLFDELGQPRMRKQKRMKPLLEQEYSDTLLLAALRGWMPEKYGRTEITGPGGGPIDSKIEVVFRKA